MRSLAFAVVLMVAALPARAEDPVAAPAVQVMTLGVYHLHNPGADEHNIEVDSVLTPRRQAELEALVETLAEFAPTHVLVETVAPGPDYAVRDYPRFDDAMLLRDPNEIVQIGFRLARRVGLSTVHGVDVQAREGEASYFPIAEVRAAAEKSGQAALLAPFDARIARWAEDFSAAQAERSIAQSLHAINRDDFPGGQAYYDAILQVIHDDELAGAHLNARWYARNAGIFSKLMNVTRPGDRVVLIYGAGHAAWLRHFARTIDGYEDVDAMPYLERAAAR